jgi:hypothetical protein
VCQPHRNMRLPAPMPATADLRLHQHSELHNIAAAVGHNPGLRMCMGVAVILVTYIVPLSM